MLYAFIILSFILVTIGIAYYSWRKTRGSILQHRTVISSEAAVLLE